MNTLQVEIETIDYAGRTYAGFHARRDPATGPGWYVFGRADGVSANVVKLCARPVAKPRAHPHYNVKVRSGFKAKWIAAKVAAVMTANLRSPVPAATYTLDTSNAAALFGGAS